MRKGSNETADSPTRSGAERFYQACSKVGERLPTHGTFTTHIISVVDMIVRQNWVIYVQCLGCRVPLVQVLAYHMGLLSHSSSCAAHKRSLKKMAGSGNYFSLIGNRFNDNPRVFFLH